MSTTRRFLAVMIMMAMMIGMLSPVKVDAAEETVTCVIDSSNNKKVTIRVKVDGGIKTDDSKLYLFAVPTYVDSVAGQTPVTSVAYTGKGTYTFTIDLKDGSASSVLYSKFYVGVKKSGAYSAITKGNFITNPEAIADSKVERVETASKKGIHATLSMPTDLESLGIKHAYFIINYADFISNTKTEYSYTYNGQTYYFNKDIVNNYDNLIGNMSRAGMAVTIKLVNTYKKGYEYLLYPGTSYRAGTMGYAINTSTDKGLKTIAAATHYLAERYSGAKGSYGQVDNWIVGNEVNDNLQYYYMGEQNVDTFVQEYLQSFRVIYSAVKSAYSNANVYICLQHRWNTTNSKVDYSGKSFIDKFNSYAKEQGDMDWGLSYHPYSYPLNDADILNDGEASVDQYGNTVFGGAVTNNVSTAVITMKNLDVLTNYFTKSELKSPSGEVRSIILGEQGYTSNSNVTGKNEAKQAANIALAYYIAEMNEHIDAFLLRTQTDENEGSEYYKFGLWTAGSDGNPNTAKYAYEMYKYIDTKDSLKYTEFAKAALNISDWSAVVANWDASKLSTMGQRVNDKLYSVTGSTVSTTVATGMQGTWEKSYNIFDIGNVDHAGGRYPQGLAVANYFAYYKEYQGVEAHFDKPLNLSASNYLTMDVNFRPMDDTYASDQLEIIVRLHSGNDVYDAKGVVKVGKDYTLAVDISQWNGRKSIDVIEVLIREQGQKKSFAGTFTVYNTKGATAVTGKTSLAAKEETKTDISAAEVSFQKNFNYSGKAIEPAVTVKVNGKKLTQHQDYDVIYHDNVNEGQGKIVVVGIGKYSGYITETFTIQGGFPTVYKGVDYAAVYAYGYYLENNPQVVAEVGTDPQALLEHFVTKGMKYALQAVGDFNVLAYAKINDDLQAKYGQDWAAYYKHYLTYGIAEGRSTSGIKPADMTAPVYPQSSKPGGDQGGSQGGNQGGTTDKDPARKPGDVNGDGAITVTDMIQIKSHILKKTTLTGAEAKAADISGDGSITITDFIQVKSRILGKN